MAHAIVRCVCVSKKCACILVFVCREFFDGECFERIIRARYSCVTFAAGRASNLCFQALYVFRHPMIYTSIYTCIHIRETDVNYMIL